MLNNLYEEILKKEWVKFSASSFMQAAESGRSRRVRICLFISHFSRNFWTTAMVNFDESSWPLMMVSETIVAERGAETVNRFINGDAKAMLTFFASVIADGTKLRLILVAKGKTTLCHKEFGRQHTYPHETSHSPNGWCAKVLMV
jgi:hypothetical protein